jgi:hypothetical protein
MAICWASFSIETLIIKTQNLYQRTNMLMNQQLDDLNYPGIIRRIGASDLPASISRGTEIRV